jgi:hypothetical protein
VAEPNDWQDVHDPTDWVDAPEGGAEGGSGSDSVPSKRLIRPTPVATESPTQKAARELQSKQQLATEMSHGQWLSELGKREPDAAKKYLDRQNTGAAAEALSLARGTPLIGAHLDELAGAAQSGSISGPEYEKKRDLARQTMDAAQSHSPSGAAIGSLAFAPFQPTTALGRIGLGTAEGASEGLGNAPDMAHALKPTLAGAGTGLATSAVGEGIRSAGGAIGDKRAAVMAKNRGATDATIDEGFDSLKGALGGDTSAGSGILKQLRDALENPHTDPALRRQIEEFLSGEAGVALHNQVVRSNLGRAPGQLSKIQASRDALTDYIPGMSEEARAAAAQRRLDDPSALIRRVQELGPKVVLPAVGAAVGGPLGAMAGAGTSAVLGRSATTVRNALADPYVASRVLGAGEAGLKGLGAATQAAAPMTSRAVTDPLSRWSKFLRPDEEQKP